MPVLELALVASNILGTSSSMIGALDVLLRRAKNITAEELFKNAFVDAVKENAQRLAHFTETLTSETVEVDESMLDNVIASLGDREIITLTTLEENERLTRITSLFSKCIILPRNQLTTEAFEETIRPVIGKTIADFLNQLPFNQGAFNEFLLESTHTTTSNQAALSAEFRVFLDKFETESLRFQNRIAEITQAIKNDTDEIKETSQANLDVSCEMSAQLADITTQVQGLSSRLVNVINIPEAIAAEHQSEIDNARDLLNRGSPYAARDLLENLKKRIWQDSSPNIKYRILATTGAFYLALNKEQKAARSLIEAFQYNCEDEQALANRASAHFLLGELENAADYANKTLERNPVNADAYAILVGVSAEGETLEEVINKVPEHLQENPQIACAVAGIAKERGEFEEAIKWGETMVKHEENDLGISKAMLAAILTEQVSTDRKAMLTSQITDSQEAQLRRAIQLFTEAWDCIAKTELRAARTDWLINKSSAHSLLSEAQDAIMALDTAIEIEKTRPDLLMRRALLSLKHEDENGAIGFLQEIRSAPETPEAPLLIANILLGQRQFSEAITILSDFLSTPPSLELKNDANHLLIKIYIAQEDFDKAREISEAMLKSSRTSVLNLVDAARISRATGQTNEALSQLKEAYEYAQNSQDFQAIIALADELFNYREFEKAATLYERIADTRLNSQWTMCLLDSYYHAGERKKTLEICRSLREKYGPLQKITEMEFLIYNEIGDMNQARAVGEMYVNAFPNDIEMPIRLGVIHLRSNHFEELDRLLETPFDVKNLSLRASFDLAHLHKIRSKPETALDIMYEARRAHYEDAEAHLKYMGLFYQVDMELEEELNPNRIEPGTAVCVESYNQTSWYIVEERDDADFARGELNVNHSLAQRLLGKHLNEEFRLGQNPLVPEMGKITDIKSKYVHAFQEVLRNFSEQFPESKAMWAIKLEDSQDTDNSDKIRPLLDFIDMEDEASIRIRNLYRETPLPIGAFTNLTGRDFLDTWHLLRSDPDLGIRCNTGNIEEIRRALALLRDGQRKIIVAPISLVTLHGLGVADTVIKAVGRLGIAQSTIDEILQIINEKRGMWSKRERMHVGKKDGKYVRCIISPEDARQSIEYLESVMAWVGENCDVLPCTPALEMNQVRKQELDNKFQAAFVDSLLIASEPGTLLLSDDELLRSYAKTYLKIDAGTNYNVDSVWTQILLKHCLDRELLEKSEYDKMTIKLICSNYYHTFFDADLLIEAAKQSDWTVSESYNAVVRTLGNQRTHLFSALDVSVDFLFKLWIEAIPLEQREYLTLQLLGGLTSRRRTAPVLNQLADLIRERFTLLPFAEAQILALMQAYTQTRPY